MFNFSTHEEKRFYRAFLEDLERCKQEVIIESPFISAERITSLWQAFRQLIARGVKVYVMTGDPREHSEGHEEQSEYEIQEM